MKEMRIPDHLTCLLRNLYAGQEATFRTGHGPTDWFQIRKGIHQGCILSMKCYSATKRNAFASVPMRCWNPEPIIQSEVSHKEKDIVF